MNDILVALPIKKLREETAPEEFGKGIREFVAGVRL
jgi:hypothetical protein